MMAVRRQRDEPKDGEHLDEPNDAKKMSFVCRIDSASVSPPAPSHNVRMDEAELKARLDATRCFLYRP
jgi:hypothetical protein